MERHEASFGLVTIQMNEGDGTSDSSNNNNNERVAVVQQGNNHSNNRSGSNNRNNNTMTKSRNQRIIDTIPSTDGLKEMVAGLQKTCKSVFQKKNMIEKLKVLKSRKRKLTDISKIEEYNKKIKALEDKIIEDSSGDSDDSSESYEE